MVLGLAYLLPALSVAGASLASPWLRFHIPLIKPGVRFSRTGLSDKAVLHMLLHTFAHEQLALRSAELVQPQLLMQVLVRKSVLALSRHLELHTQPLTHPIADVTVDATVSFVDSADTEIVRPTT